MDPLRFSFLHLLLLLASLSCFPASADRRFGCLFESELCSPYEICVNDGMFGRCHSVPVKEIYTYDVSPSVVQHFRMLLEKLSNRGLTWEDDTTQQVLSKELSKLRRIPYRAQQNGPVYNTDSRPVAQAMDPVDQRVKPVEVELSRNLQIYLQRLGLLPKTSASSLSASSKSDRFQSGIPADFYRSKAQTLAQKSPPSSFSSLSSFQPVQKQRPSANQLLTTQAEGDLLLGALRQYLSGHASLHSGGVSPSERLRTFYSNGIQNSGLKKETSKSRLVNMGRTQGALAKDPLTSVDERFIKNVLKNVDRQHVDVETLTPQDLDQLSSLISEALQVVDQDQGLNRGLGQMRGPGPRDLEGELSDGEEERGEEEEEEVSRDELLENAPTLKPQESTPIALAALQERHTDAEEQNVKDEVESGSLFTKLLAYLDKTSFTSPLPAKNHYDDAMQAPRGQQVGLENVQSRTSEAGVAVQKKDATQSVEEVSEVEGWIKEVAPPPASLVYDEPHKKTMHVPDLQLDVKASKKKGDDVFGYIITDTDGLQTDEGLHLMEILARMAKIQMTDFAELSVVGPAVTFKVSPNAQNVSTADVANVAVKKKVSLEKEAKVSILEAGVADESQINQIPTKYSQTESTKFLILTIVSILCIVGVLLASTVVYCLRHRSHHKLKEKLTNLGTETSSDATATYQELCRQRMAVKPPAERPEPISSRINSVSSQFSDGGQAVSPSARSSISSWSEEPAHSNMDISTGHMILSYMEDHLKNKDRLEKEWEALCAYQAEPNACTTGLKDGNSKKNRSTAVVAYDHSRITLKVENSQGNSDYINASPIVNDHDPRNPAYIATQGPLPSTVADFWQMVWENGCVVVFMLTPLVESGVKQCYHYWPDEGSNLYHIYEVNWVSEHIWCDDFLVRSFYLKNMQTNETRTVTQFHFLTWLNQNVPETSRTLLDFRRKVNKCYRGRSCPIIVHCSDGAGRTGTYILIDMVLNKMAKGAKEIDIAATLEHLRDQRPGMVQTKDVFEFALTAVAEEVNAILKALPQ
ncbi:LOW QUALITY PROTEIN: receptor-type tyrosine-protein phosphatase N2-like [Archocentrus centrarchus]|uniref:LOW QUALITY PROTEIN: receptor-type tyrosine-protein phosphatase N2-like n=1 Tax=Archocentrus centrarchus TaxID=63155 RepID=UPI0011EA27B5|nr:LOW QUALITY PROTEIN: receptor-type tyrosine-protein phosphatase N2-like [Archocentrus centrarchus]